MMSEAIPLNAWRGRLITSKNGVKKSLTNLMLLLKYAPDLGSTIRWNELAEQAEWNGTPIEDRHLIDIRLILEREQYECSKEEIYGAVLRHARENSYHPVRDYLRSLKWDGTPRLDHWLTACLGAVDAPFVRIAGRKTLIAAVARAFRPGCKVDTVLVLEGPQGIQKSTAIATMFGENWTAESVNLFDQHNKMVMSMMGAWVVELAEFIAIAKKDQNAVKGMLSMRVDRVVLPYAKMLSAHPRQCIFFGTINPGEGGYLTDGTGNRRYWPVEVAKADIDLIVSRRDQIWAEAYRAFLADEQWWMTEEEEALARAQVAVREKTDIWDEVLEAKLIGNGVETTTVSAALQAIGVPNERMDAKAEERCAASLRRLGYASTPRKARDETGKRKSIRLYVRKQT